MKSWFIYATLLIPHCHSLSATSYTKRRIPSSYNRAHSQPTSMVAVGDDCVNMHNPHNSLHWKIWSVINELETNGISNSNNAHVRSKECHNIDVTNTVVQILRYWGDLWAGQSDWQSLLNKKALLHEVEESIVALQFLVDWLEDRSKQNNNSPVTLVDVCCGKGILSMLASYLFRGKTASHVFSIIMLDKQQNINWNHIVESNKHAESEDRPTILTWGGCNLHDVDTIVERLEGYDTCGPLALIGIHLCKQLSPSCIGLVNILGPEKCSFLCLAPCCLPRVVTTMSKSRNGGMMPKRIKSAQQIPLTISVRTHESEEERQARKEANLRRDGAMKRTFADVPCYLCSETHPIHKCNLLPFDENERIDIFQKAAALNPCWKCGETGHFRENCPKTEQPSRPRLALPPTMDLDVTGSELCSEQDGYGLFEGYCHLLGTAVQRADVKVLDVGLVNNSAYHDNAANLDNWNRDRKSIFIVSTTS
jgi:hypothetical protein